MSGMSEAEHYTVLYRCVTRFHPRDVRCLYHQAGAYAAGSYTIKCLYRCLHCAILSPLDKIATHIRSATEEHNTPCCRIRWPMANNVTGCLRKSSDCENLSYLSVHECPIGNINARLQDCLERCAKR